MALIALGVCGGIGAYKAVEVARSLQKRGHEIVALMTRNAELQLRLETAEKRMAERIAMLEAKLTNKKGAVKN